MMTITLPMNEFREYMVETDEAGGWGDAYFTKVFGDSDTITIEYKYAPYSNGKSTIIWRVEGTEKAYRVRYTGSSRFAMWWCGYTDDIESDDD